MHQRIDSPRGRDQLETMQAIAPSYRELRPLKEPITSTFPVYKDLADTLVKTHAIPDERVAHVLATCAGYAYSDESTVAMIAARLGLPDNRCLRISESVEPMFICSTSFLLQSRCGRVAILCYRGTQPANLINWLTNADVNPEAVPFPFPDTPNRFRVHAGFYRNVRATRYEVIGALARALEGKSIVTGAPDPGAPLEALYITGHSLGAAMAALMALMISTEPSYRAIAAKLRAVYTFGQPMIGEPALAQRCNRHPFLGSRVLRYIYRHDVVATLPPSATGDFAHFGPERQFVIEKDGTGTWQEKAQPTRQLSNSLDLSLAGLAFVANQLRHFRKLTFLHSIDDHGPHHYIAALKPRDVATTEFGDEQ